MKKYSIERRMIQGGCYKYSLITRIYNNYKRADQEFKRIIRTYPSWELCLGYSGRDDEYCGLIAIYKPKGK